MCGWSFHKNGDFSHQLLARPLMLGAFPAVSLTCLMDVVALSYNLKLYIFNPFFHALSQVVYDLCDFKVKYSSMLNFCTAYLLYLVIIVSLLLFARSPTAFTRYCARAPQVILDL